MVMNPRIVEIEEKKLVGVRVSMSLVNNQMAAMWARFMPKRNQIGSVVGTNLFSIALYPDNYFHSFDPHVQFERWAAAEVVDFVEIPEGFETFVLPSGAYAVFDYKGLSTDNSIFQEIYGSWLPASEYQLDSRPHFELLGEKYKNNDPESEEEIWIPVSLI